ncbi:MAG TPA: hypothetical protein VJQ08_13755 [Candidatus Dormibacteraeota bacterium]|nr:hypothetical protein [Candidatus Dormibacteraeota bacterium]
MKAFSPLVEDGRSPGQFLFLSVQPAFPLVRLGLPVVRNLLALAGDSLALICDVITLVGDAIARSFVGLDSIRPLSPTASDFGVYIALVLSRVPVGLLVLSSRRVSNRAHDGSYQASRGTGRSDFLVGSSRAWSGRTTTRMCRHESSARRACMN